MTTTNETTSELMQMRTLGRTELPVSPLGFGAAPIGLLETEQECVGTILNELLDTGVNLIDTTAGYAGSEEAIGKAVSHRRDEYILVSKCGQSFPDLPGEAWSEAVITATIERALRRLRTDRLDVMLLHSCDLETLQKGEAIETLVKARDAGKVRIIGYSGDNEAVTYAARHPEVLVVETSISMMDQANIDHLLPVAREFGVGVIAKRSVANAAWRPMESQQGFYQSYAQEYHDRFQKMGLRLEDLGLESGVDWAEVALRFTLSQPGLSAAIIGTTKPENAKRNVQVAAKPPLPAGTIEQIRRAFAKARDESNQDWLALT